MAVRLLTAIIYRETDDDGANPIYIAECPDVGTASQGETIEAALANLQEATELYLEVTGQPATRHIFVTTFEAMYAETTASHGE